MSDKKTNGIWKVKAIQLDLARHMEPISYILEYIDSASRNGFNTLVLYLEGRIRTRSFPYRPAGETYSPEEMGGIVKYAAKKGIEVIPVIPALGHAEHFLTCKDMTHLSEERNGKGRFGNATPFVFCISQKETYDFIENYFAEIAEIFPGKNFHAGLDEAWNFGFCPLCRKKWRKEGLGKMFLGHVKKIEDILRKLGKRMWMWDDMFEIFPEELRHAPKNIVMCHWNYDANIEAEGSQAHFTSRFRQDWLKEYEKLGIDAVFCPWDRYVDNIESITKYAKSKKVIGGILTQWEGSPRFVAAQPFISNFTGRLWNGDSLEKAWGATINDYYKGSDTSIRESLKIIVSLPRQHFRSDVNYYMSGSLQREEILEQNLLNLAIECLSEKAGTIPANRRLEFDKLLWAGKMDMIFWGLRKIIPEIHDPLRNSASTQELKAKLAGISSSYRKLMGTLKSSMRKWNIGINPDDMRFMERYRCASILLTDLEGCLKTLPQESDWLVIVRLYLQDFYGSPRLKISAVAKNKTLAVAEGCFKPDTIFRGRTGGYYDYYFPLKSNETPELVRIEGWLYGGQGICFIELKNKAMNLKPSSLKSFKGPVSNSKAVLTDDSSFAMLGGTGIREQMLNPELAEKRGIIECSLKSC